jgi:MinD superfamily P-loop ATPase
MLRILPVSCFSSNIKQSSFFPELCHSCGGCKLVCPAEAIGEVERRIGVIRECEAENGKIRLIYGLLEVGEPRAVPLVEAVKNEASKNLEDIIIIDAPPGTSCPVVSAVKDADYLLLVAEPTPMGLHDFQIMVKVAKQLNLKFGVAINKAGLGGKEIYETCSREKNSDFSGNTLQPENS